MFSFSKEGEYSVFRFKGKIILKKILSTTEVALVLETLNIGYTIGSMDIDSPMFQQTFAKMQKEVDTTIDELNKNLGFDKDSDG